MAKIQGFIQITCISLLIASDFVRIGDSKICWDLTWYNASTPNLHHGSEIERQSKAVLDSICPDGGPVLGANCMNDKGESIGSFKNDTVDHYVATCSVFDGLVCQPYFTVPGAVCPDFAIQYACNCPAPTTPRWLIPVSTGSPKRTIVTTKRHTIDITSDSTSMKTVATSDRYQTTNSIVSSQQTKYWYASKPATDVYSHTAKHNGGTTLGITGSKTNSQTTVVHSHTSKHNGGTSFGLNGNKRTRQTAVYRICLSGLLIILNFL